MDTKVQLNIESGDVVHSFYVPKFLYKIQAIPGQINRMHFTADETGRFEGQCAQFCGLNHAQMLLVVEVVTQEEYDAWVAEQQAEQEETPTPDEGDGPDGGPPSTEIVAEDVEFDTDEITVPAGAPVAVTLDNRDDGVVHNIAFYTDDSAEELIAGTELEPGPVMQDLDFEAPAEPGEYFFQCDAHPATMTGTLVVE